jgi:hypothetical protein
MAVSYDDPLRAHPPEPAVLMKTACGGLAKVLQLGRHLRATDPPYAGPTGVDHPAITAGFARGVRPPPSALAGDESRLRYPLEILQIRDFRAPPGFQAAID